MGRPRIEMSEHDLVNMTLKDAAKKYKCHWRTVQDRRKKFKKNLGKVSKQQNKVAPVPTASLVPLFVLALGIGDAFFIVNAMSHSSKEYILGVAVANLVLGFFAAANLIKGK